MKKRGIFVAGTGTDVGKTFVSALLVKSLRERGVNAGYFKPALSGAVREGERLVPGDAQMVCECAGLPGDPADYVAYCYEPAVSPHLAAQLSGKPIEPDGIMNRFQEIASRFDYVLTEGCGGIFCPLRTDSRTLLLTDVASLLGYEVVLVSPSGLGAINAAVLAVQYAQNRGLHLRAVIMNQFEDENFLHQDNKKQIERFTGLEVVPVARNARTISADFLLESSALA